MATLTGTIQSVALLDTPNGPVRDSSNNEVWNAVIYFTITGTYVQNDNAQLTSVPTTMQTRLGWGRTITLLDAMFAAPGDENGTAIGCKTVAVSSTSITFELTGADLTTEHAGAALATVGKPIALRVCFTCPSAG